MTKNGKWGMVRHIARGYANREKRTMTTTITQENLMGYATGELTYDPANPSSLRVDRSDIKVNNEERRDIKIFAGILDDLFNSTEEGKFRRRSKTSYTYFEGFGLMYNMKFTTSSRSAVYIEIADGTNITTAPTSNKDDGKKLEEYYAQLEENFPAFEQADRKSVV